MRDDTHTGDATADATINHAAIYNEMMAAGQEIDNHESDLYVMVTAKSAAIVARYEYKSAVSTFTNHRDDLLWFDIPFHPVLGQQGITMTTRTTPQTLRRADIPGRKV